MNLYTAAVYTNNYCEGQRHHIDLNEREKQILVDLNATGNILESWHYVGKQSYVDAMRANKAQVFLDSGAFSAYTLGVSLDVQTYCNYIKQNMDLWRVDEVPMFSVLDGIGDPLQTWRNQKTMEALGCRPLPCFHAGEDDQYLDYYVNNYEYITLGGLVGSSTKALCIWLDRVWEKMVDGSGRPKCKVHGFGITAIPIMERYPWHSCDSSSWIQAASFGSIVTPEHGPLSVSEKSPSRHDAGQHVSTLTPIEQDYVFQMLEKQGFTYERLSQSYKSRAAYNLWAYGVIGAMMNAQNNYEKFTAQVQELF